MDLTIFNNENISDCGKSIFTIIGDNGNENNVFTHYEEVPSGTLKRIKKQDKVYIEGCLIRRPREILRLISQNCRTQKVSSKVQYELQGSVIYNPEKVDEIERIFHSKDLFLNGIKIQFEGGAVFEPISESFPNEFRLRVLISECEKYQIFGCSQVNKFDYDAIITDGGVETDGGTDIMTFGIPANSLNKKFFNDSGLQVANSYPALLEYYEAKPNVLTVTDVPVFSTDVPFVKVFDVQFLDQTPDPFYFDSFSPAKKVNGLLLSEPAAYNELSRGMNKEVCIAVTVGALEEISTDCEAVIIGVLEVINTPCTICAMNDFEADPIKTKVTYLGSQRRISLGLRHDSYEFKNTEIGDATFTAVSTSTCTFVSNAPFTADRVRRVSLNGMPIYGVAGTISGTDINLSPCLTTAVSDSVVARVTKGLFEFEKIIVGVINGGCNPLETIVLTNSDDAQIPIGAELTITTNGIIYYQGAPTSFTPTDKPNILFVNINF